jgi:hypothetical protein
VGLGEFGKTGWVWRLIINWVEDPLNSEDVGIWTAECFEHGRFYTAEGGMAPDHDDCVAAAVEHSLYDHGVELVTEPNDWLTSHASPEYMERA